MGFFRRVATIETAHRTDQGMVRTGNEDRVAVVPLGSTPAWGTCLVVADGIGGNAGGERASRRVVEMVGDRMADWQIQADRLGPRFAAVVDRFLMELADAVHRRVQVEGADDTSLEGMGSTMTLLGLVDDHAWFVLHVGDSRAYLLRDGALRQLTTDHEDPDSGALLQSVGGRSEVTPEILTGRIEPGDRFLVCSDGLNKHLTDPAIAAVLESSRSPAQAADRLVAEANRLGGKDNISVALAAVPSRRSTPRRTTGPGASARQHGVRAVLVLLLVVTAGTATASYLAFSGVIGRPNRPVTLAAGTKPIVAPTSDDLSGRSPLAARAGDASTESPVKPRSRPAPSKSTPEEGKRDEPRASAAAPPPPADEIRPAAPKILPEPPKVLPESPPKADAEAAPRPAAPAMEDAPKIPPPREEAPQAERSPAPRSCKVIRAELGQVAEGLRRAKVAASNARNAGRAEDRRRLEEAADRLDDRKRELEKERKDNECEK